MNTSSNRPEMDKATALSILKSRAMINVGVTKNVAVTNVSFVNGVTNKPFIWDSGSSKGEPYAIANFNAINEYGHKEAIRLFKEGKLQEAVNTNLTARVTLEKGRALQQAMFASVVAELTDVERKLRDEEGNVVFDEDGEPQYELDSDGEIIIDKAVLIRKCIPNEAIDASETKLSFDELEEEVEETVDAGGAPTGN